jgi:hypothetical protein
VRQLLAYAVLALLACGSDSPQSAIEPDRSRWRTELPADITSELASYVNREFGAPEFSRPLEPTDFTYVGEFLVAGVPTKYWSFPCKFDPGCWAIVSPWDDSYSLAWGGTPPPANPSQPPDR